MTVIFDAEKDRPMHFQSRVCDVVEVTHVRNAEICGFVQHYNKIMIVIHCGSRKLSQIQVFRFSKSFGGTYVVLRIVFSSIHVF